MPAEWAARHNGAERQFTGKGHAIQFHRLKALPKQNNYTDCGLFLLTYLEYFAAFLPAPEQDLHKLLDQANSSSPAAADRALEGEGQQGSSSTSLMAPNIWICNSLCSMSWPLHVLDSGNIFTNLCCPGYQMTTGIAIRKYQGSGGHQSPFDPRAESACT